jgi:hypothetical protein
MRKIIYGAAFVAVVILLVTGVNFHPQQPATASSQTKAGATTDVRALMSTIDVEALPKDDTLSEAEE